MQESDDSKLIDVLAKVLTSSGIPKVKHNSYISQVLKITTSAGYKKLTGSTKWEVLQLIKIVESIGMSMTQFFEVYDDDGKEIHEAVWHDGKTEHTCQVRLIPEDEETLTTYSALKVGDVWNVLLSSEIKDGYLFDAKRSIESIIIHPEIVSNKKYRIALLDDEDAITETLKEILNSTDYRIDTFDNIKSLQKKIQQEPYDAYVLDWVVGNETSYDLIQLIRKSSKKNAMIVVLTGKLSGINDNEISTAIHDYDIIGPYEKPIKTGIIKSNVDKYFMR
ncbi:helix-turn-helix domain-containing protein [Enterobacter asburiae]|uniref:helix-turn-helix domain-containing protein n=1 Tax=Enterobacter asburiae TaxID=61645 RepID=UPI003F42CE9B